MPPNLNSHRISHRARAGLVPSAETSLADRDERLRADTRSILSRARKPRLGFRPGWAEDSDTASSDLSPLLSSAHFLGVWRRTRYVEDSWPKCLCGADPSACGLAPFDAPNGVVWKFIDVLRGDGADGAGAVDSVATRRSLLCYLECVDWSDIDPHTGLRTLLS